MPILKKLNTTEKFPRKMMYIDKSALGLRLMRPKTMLSMQSMNLHIGNIRAKYPKVKIILGQTSLKSLNKISFVIHIENYFQHS